MFGVAGRLMSLRFSILAGTVLASLPLLASGGGSGLLGGLFVLDSLQLFVVVTLAVWVAWLVLATAQLTYLYAPQRFAGVDAASAWWRPAFEVWLARRRSAVALLLAAPVVTLATLRSTDVGVPLRLAAIAGGVLAAGFWLAMAALLEAWLVPAGESSGLLPRLAGPGARLLARLAARPAPRFALAARRLLGRLAADPLLGDGYVDQRRNLLPGHAVALALLALSLAGYVALGFLQAPGPGTTLFSGAQPGASSEFRHQPLPGVALSWLHDPWFPALGYLLLILMLLTLALPAIAFFCDRFRLPVLLLLVAVSIVVTAVSGSQHFFYVRLAGGAGGCEDPGVVPDWDDRARAAELLLGEHPRALVVVAAAGGGLTASAWAAQVLSGIAEDREVGGLFLDSLGLVSAVSGGSVGTMFFVDRLPDEPAGAKRALPPEVARAIREAAQASSLEAAAWGLAYPDLLRGFFAPVVRGLTPWADRSWALETTWSRRLAARDGKDGRREVPTLGDWRSDLLAGRRKPWILFNATTVETGAPMRFSTLARHGGDEEFWGLFPGADLPVVSAVRLSATFPVVSAPAQARSTRCRGERILSPAHFVDGGYYENSGLLAALESLDDLLSQPGVAARLRGVPVLVLLIQPFGGESESTIADSAADPWSAAVLAPLQATLNVRDASQRRRALFEQKLFTERFSDPAAAGPRVELFSASLEGVETVSWRLTRRDREAIAASWTRLWRGDAEMALFRRRLLDATAVASGNAGP